MKGGSSRPRGPRIRLLTREEIALWRLVTADVIPHASKLGVAKPATVEAEPPAPVTVAPLIFSPDELSPVEKKLKTPTRPPLTPLAPLERRLKKQLASGRTGVDDVIDLHGMTQAQAHHALNAFMWRAADDGARIVLVITGKGGPQDAFGHSIERGVLRRNVPHWLKEAQLRPIVLSVEEAARPHGGSGALYVRLRRRQQGADRG